MRRFVLDVLGIAAAVASATACGGSPETTGTGGSTITVVVEPSSPTIAIGAHLTLRATVTGPFGISQRVNWRSLQDTVASVNSSGVVTAITGGTANVRASWAENADVFGVAIVTVPGILEPPPAIRAAQRR